MTAAVTIKIMILLYLVLFPKFLFALRLQKSFKQTTKSIKQCKEKDYLLASVVLLQVLTSVIQQALRHAIQQLAHFALNY